MASAVDLCNLALSHLGDVSNVQSISPPDGSAQAEHCARFYPIARDSLLEKHDWNFATRRLALAPLGLANKAWALAYAVPNDVIRVISVMDANAGDDDSFGFGGGAIPYGYDGRTGSLPRGSYTPQPFSIEGSPVDGTPVILTNQAGPAIARCTVRVVDTNRFSPLFSDALGWYLASMLAGPVLKGEAGVKANQVTFAAYQRVMADATASDSRQRRTSVRDRQAVPWLQAR